MAVVGCAGFTGSSCGCLVLASVGLAVSVRWCDAFGQFPGTSYCFVLVGVGEAVYIPRKIFN